MTPSGATRRQKQLLSGVAAGLTLAQIAKLLKISPCTMDHHYRQMAAKYQLRDSNLVLLLRHAVAERHLPKDVLSIDPKILLTSIKRAS
ncbi:MAG: LuxR C-terminal-related transcriptional regulator [Nitrospirales bacterium]